MRRRGANRYRRRGPGAPQARPPQEPLSAAGFLAELSAGGALPAHASVEATALLLAVEALPDRDAVVRRLAGYAAAAVAEVWVIDVRSGWTEAYRSPWAGAYRSRTLWYPGEALPLRALPGVAVVALEAA